MPAIRLSGVMDWLAARIAPALAGVGHIIVARIQQMGTLRVAALICGAGLIAWLAFDTSKTDRRISALDASLREGTIGAATAGDTDRLRTALNGIVAALHISIPVNVNRSFERGALNVYVTTPRAESVTHCGAGNALYDPELDAIFIDSSFLSDSGFRNIYAASAYSSVVSFKRDLIFPDVFLRFVLLHEIGHRQLHRHISGFFPHTDQPTSARLRQMEREADRFAVAGLETFYKWDATRPIHLIGDSLGDAIGLEDGVEARADPRTRADVDIAATIYLMANMNLYIWTPYSPFFTSASHPAFLDRGQGAIDAILAEKGLDLRIRASLRLLRQSLGRERSVSQRNFREVLVPAPINDVSYGPSDVLIAATGNSRMYRVARLAQHNPLTSPQAIAYATAVGSVLASNGDSPNQAFWTRANESSVVVDSGGESWLYRKGERARYSLPAPTPNVTRHCFHLTTPPQPTQYALVRFCDDKQGDVIYSLRADRMGSVRTLTSLREDLAARLGQPVKDIEVAAQTERTIQLNVFGPGDALRPVGVATIAPGTLQVVDASLVRGSQALPTQPDDKVVPVVRFSGAGAQQSFAAAAHGTNGMESWLLPSQGDPSPFLRTSSLLSDAGTSSTAGLAASFKPYILGYWALDDGRGLVYLANDSLYYFDPVRRRLDIVFHPAFEGMDIRVGTGGEWAMFIRGGQRIFLFRS